MLEQMSLENCALLLGRRTYEIFASYWPGHASGWPGINEVCKYFVSSDPSPKAEWKDSVPITGNVAVEVKRLKEKDGPELHVWGSGNLVQTLLRHDLVYELWLKIFPVLPGQGKKLFEDGAQPMSFDLTRSIVGPGGVILANYEKAGKVRTGSHQL